MAKFQKSKFRNGGRVSSEQKWVDLDHPKPSWKRGRSSKSSGIIAKSIASAVRKSVRESLKTPTTKSSGYGTSYKRTKVEERTRTTLSIDEMPEELRYLSYPHLKPKAVRKPKIAASEKVTEKFEPERVSSLDGSYWDLLRILWMFVKDVFGASRKQ